MVLKGHGSLTHLCILVTQGKESDRKVHLLGIDSLAT